MCAEAVCSESSLKLKLRLSAALGYDDVKPEWVRVRAV